MDEACGVRQSRVRDAVGELQRRAEWGIGAIVTGQGAAPILCSHYIRVPAAPIQGSTFDACVIRGAEKSYSSINKINREARIYDIRR